MNRPGLAQAQGPVRAAPDDMIVACGKCLIETALESLVLSGVATDKSAVRSLAPPLVLTVADAADLLSVR